jgi:hypothetical protein
LFFRQTCFRQRRIMFRQRIVMIGEKEGGLFVAIEIVSSDFGVCGRLHPAAGHDGAEDRELAALTVRTLC